MRSADDEADHNLGTPRSFKRLIVESSDDEIVKNPTKFKKLRKKYLYIEQTLDQTSEENACISDDKVDDLESDEKVSLPSDFEEDILSCGKYSSEVESNANSDIFEIEDDVISISSSLYEYPEESVGYLFCYLCGISKATDSFSAVQQKEADLEGSAYCLIHHHGSMTYSRPRPLSSDESSTHSSSTHSDEASHESVISASVGLNEESSDSDNEDNHVFEFGKYKGTTYDYVWKHHHSYCTWALNQQEPSKDLERFQNWIRTKPADSFSEVQRKEADLDRSASCLIHHDSSMTDSPPRPLSSDASSTHSSLTHSDEASHESLIHEVELIKESYDSDNEDYHVLEFGQYKGTTYDYVWNHHHSYCTWAHNQQEPSKDLERFKNWIRTRIICTYQM
jgi:hypothetical protein